jgi:hypothetical protein
MSKCMCSVLGRVKRVGDEQVCMFGVGRVSNMRSMSDKIGESW